MIVTPSEPMLSVGTIIDAFAGLAALYLIKLVIEIRDAVFGGRRGVGMVATVRELSESLTRHCKDERNFWNEVTDGRNAIAHRAELAVAVSEERLREDFTILNAKVDALGAERRTRRKGQA
jgi:hypothetical protein